MDTVTTQFTFEPAPAREKSDREKLDAVCRAVLLFYKASFWTQEDSMAWFNLTQCTEATTKNLCDFVRRMAPEETR